jgi:hypothetical protein
MRPRWWYTGIAAAVLAVGTACTPFSSGGGTTGTSGVDTTRAASAGASGGSGVPSGTAKDDAAFCALAKTKAPAYLNVFDGDSSTPAERRAAVANIDALTAAAPAALHEDFVRWDKLEHALLDEGNTPSEDVIQQAGSTEVRDSLLRIATYLKQTCGIAVNSS